MVMKIFVTHSCIHRHCLWDHCSFFTIFPQACLNNMRSWSGASSLSFCKNVTHMAHMHARYLSSLEIGLHDNTQWTWRKKICSRIYSGMLVAHLPYRPVRSECSEPACGWRSQTGRSLQRCHAASDRNLEWLGQNCQCFPAAKKRSICVKKQNTLFNYKDWSVLQHVLLIYGINEQCPLYIMEAETARHVWVRSGF